MAKLCVFHALAGSTHRISHLSTLATLHLTRCLLVNVLSHSASGALTDEVVNYLRNITYHQGDRAVEGINVACRDLFREVNFNDRERYGEAIQAEYDAYNAMANAAQVYSLWHAFFVYPSHVKVRRTPPSEQPNTGHDDKKLMKKKEKKAN